MEPPQPVVSMAPYVNWTSSDPDTVQVTKNGTNGCKVKLTALKGKLQNR